MLFDNKVSVLITVCDEYSHVSIAQNFFQHLIASMP